MQAVAVLCRHQTVFEPTVVLPELLTHLGQVEMTI
jgi:hypothetical protein